MSYVINSYRFVLSRILRAYIVRYGLLCCAVQIMKMDAYIFKEKCVEYVLFCVVYIYVRMYILCLQVRYKAVCCIPSDFTA